MTKAFKKFSTIVMAAVMTASMAVSASAYATDSNKIMDSEYGVAEIAKVGDKEIALYPGETLVADKIIGKAIISEPNLPVLKSQSSCPNYSSSTEISQLYYVGYIQFMAAYLTQYGDGDGLIPGRHVKQAWIDYRRNGSSVINGTEYTSTAPNIYDTTIRSQTASCLDDLFDWGDDAVTEFWRGWIYFA